LFCSRQPALYPKLIQSSPCHSALFHKLHFDTIVLSMLKCPSLSLSFTFYHKACMQLFLFSPVHASCPATFIPLSTITLTIYVKQYQSLTAMCIFLHPPATYSILGPYIVHGSLLLTTLSLKHNLQYHPVCHILCILSYLNFHFNTFWHPLLPPSGSSFCL
jgi:hypothetical protein